jgi:hypothetical protein
LSIPKSEKDEETIKSELQHYKDVVNSMLESSNNFKINLSNSCNDYSAFTAKLVQVYGIKTSKKESLKIRKIK